MIDYIQKRKTDLRLKAESYRESVMQEYTGTSRGSAPYSGIGLFGSGLILTVFLILRYVSPEMLKQNQIKQEIPDNTMKGNRNENAGIKDEFKEKLILVGLEVLRQVLLTMIGKLAPLDEKAAVR